MMIISNTKKNKQLGGKPTNTEEYHEKLQDSFSFALSKSVVSLTRGLELHRYYNDDPFTPREIHIIQQRKQPIEQMNIIKRITDIIVGNLTGISSTIRTYPVQTEDADKSLAVNALLSEVLVNNSFSTESIKMHKDGLLTGLMVAKVDAITTGDKDKFGVPLYNVDVKHVPSMEVLLDPLSTADDYSDARYIHRFRWISYNELVDRFGNSEVIQKASPFDYSLLTSSSGKAKIPELLKFRVNDTLSAPDEYLVIETTVKERLYDKTGLVRNPNTYTVTWMSAGIISIDEITYKDLKFPYIIQKINPTPNMPYSSVFRGIIGTQDIINRGLVRAGTASEMVRLLVTNITDVDAFQKLETNWYENKPILSLPMGANVTPVEGDLNVKLAVVEQGVQRAFSSMGITPELQGLADASDSGRKVQIQQNAAKLGLGVITAFYLSFYNRLGMSIIKLFRQYYTTQQMLMVAEAGVGSRVLSINNPQYVWGGKVDPTGVPIMETIDEIVTDPATGKKLKVEGKYVIRPKTDPDTDLFFELNDLTVEVQPTDNEEDISRQAFAEFFNIGLPLLFEQDKALAIEIIAKYFKTMHASSAQDMSDVLLTASQEIRQQQEAEAQAMQEQAMQEQGGGGTPQAQQQQPTPMTPQQQANREAQLPVTDKKTLL